MTEQQYHVIADRDKGDDPDDTTMRAGDRMVIEWQESAYLGLGDLVRIERPVPTTDVPPVTDTSSGEHRRVIRHVGDDLPICDTCINVLGLNVRWDHAVLRHEREGITPAEAQLAPSVPTREQIAEALYRREYPEEVDPTTWSELNDQWRNDYLHLADAVLALIQKGNDR